MNNLEQLLHAARTARDLDNWTNAVNLYDQALAADPDNWEAIYYSSYCRARQCIIAQIATTAVTMTKAVELSLRKIKQLPFEQQLIPVELVARTTTDLGILLYNAAVNHYNGIDSSIRGNYVGELKQRQVGVAILLISCVSNINDLFPGTKMGEQVLIPAKAALTCDLTAEQQEVLLNTIAVYDEQYAKDFREAREKKAKADAEAKKAGRGCCFGLGIPMLIVGLCFCTTFWGILLGLFGLAAFVLGMLI